MRTLIRDAEVRGRRVDVLVTGDTIASVRPHDRSHRARSAADLVVDGEGGALLPGLHDHHLHLSALAAGRMSVDCSPEAVPNRAALLAALAAAPGDEWVRGVGYHESVAGTLDRHELDRLLPDRPLRLQHRSGALWMLNSRALDEVAGVLDDSDDVERDRDGIPTGRLWRYDARLRSALPTASPLPWDGVADDLARFGITGVTDATPELSADAASALAETAHRSLHVRLVLLGAPHGASFEHAVPGPFKLMLRDHDLPSLAELVASVARVRGHGRPVAVHCVSRVSALLTLAALEEVGPMPADRIEHGSVIPSTELPGLRSVSVVTQPQFLHTRGDDYLRDVDETDLAHLYRYASLLQAGITVVPSSDAPYGGLDPWAAMAAARDRRTTRGAIIGGEESVPVRTSLCGYLADPLDLGRTRRVAVGAPADLVLLDTSLAGALEAPASERVRHTFASGLRVR